MIPVLPLQTWGIANAGRHGLNRLCKPNGCLCLDDALCFGFAFAPCACLFLGVNCNEKPRLCTTPGTHTWSQTIVHRAAGRKIASVSKLRTLMTAILTLPSSAEAISKKQIGSTLDRWRRTCVYVDVLTVCARQSQAKELRVRASTEVKPFSFQECSSPAKGVAQSAFDSKSLRNTRNDSEYE